MVSSEAGLPANAWSPLYIALSLCVLLFSASFMFSSQQQHVKPLAQQEHHSEVLVPPAQPPERLEAVAKICAALDELGALSPNLGGQAKPAQTAFEFLDLDPNAWPFKPALSSSNIGPEAQEQVENMVMDAAVKLREKLWQQQRKRDAGTSGVDRVNRRLAATYLVSRMLIDEHARLVYLNEVHPKSKKWFERWDAARELCHD